MGYTATTDDLERVFEEWFKRKNLANKTIVADTTRMVFDQDCGAREVGEERFFSVDKGDLFDNVSKIFVEELENEEFDSRKDADKDIEDMLEFSYEYWERDYLEKELQEDREYGE